MKGGGGGEVRPGVSEGFSRRGRTAKDWTGLASLQEKKSANYSAYVGKVEIRRLFMK